MAYWFTTQDPKVLEYKEHGVWVAERFRHSGDAMRRNDEVAIYEVGSAEARDNKALGAKATVAIIRVTRKVDPPEGPDEYGFLKIAEGVLIAGDETGIPAKETIRILKGITVEGKKLGSYILGRSARAMRIDPDVFAEISEHFTEYESDADYQAQVQQSSPRPPSDEVQKPKYGKHAGGHRKLITDPSLAAHCLAESGFACQAGAGHTTFTSKASGNNYVEVHHLVPLKQQPVFKFALDNAANILALCPNCHRLLHHATTHEKDSVLRLLITPDRLRNLAGRRIRVTVDDVLGYY